MNLHLCTPILQVIDPRALLAREVAYCRSAENGVAEQRVTRHRWDEAGRSVADWDPRLWENDLPPNTTVVRSLSSQVLLNESVDAGWEARLSGADGQRVDSWDGRGSYSATEYDNQLRPACVSESLVGQPLRVVERFIYGDAFDASALHNLCGQPIRHDDPAGTLIITDYGLTGTALVQNRRFFNDVQSVDWPLGVTQRDLLLEPGEGYSTLWGFDATGASISQTDAVGNRSLYCYGIDGLLTETRLMSGQSASARSLIHDIRYSAEGQILSERLGNCVVTQNTYESETGRLIRIYASKANGSVLQDLNYQYDPVGNVVAIEDRAQPTRYSANQRIEPVNRYRYDSLYQLIEATGREVSAGASPSPALPELQNLPLDASQLSNYTQTFNYDAGGNLLQLRHVGAQSFTRNMRVAPNNNRSLSEDDTEGDFEKGFDANGNLQQLVRGQSLHWDLRNQLIRVTAVQHEDGSEDDEVYVYDGAAQRCRKIRTTQAKVRSLNAEVRYLPGLEIRSEPNGEVLHVATVEAARTGVRLLHWQEGKRDGIGNDQVRYCLNDHLGSCSLELDDGGALISQEGYYPFGATAWWAARSAVEAKYKTVRYSGKERDATGLYYYGFRYYAPWLMRWVSPDPLGHLAGLNAFRAMNNNLLGFVDPDGLAPVEPGDNEQRSMVKERIEFWEDFAKRLQSLAMPTPIMNINPTVSGPSSSEEHALPKSAADQRLIEKYDNPHRDTQEMVAQGLTVAGEKLWHAPNLRIQVTGALLIAGATAIGNTHIQGDNDLASQRGLLLSADHFGRLDDQRKAASLNDVKKANATTIRQLKSGSSIKLNSGSSINSPSGSQRSLVEMVQPLLVPEGWNPDRRVSEPPSFWSALAQKFEQGPSAAGQDHGLSQINESLSRRESPQSPSPAQTNERRRRL